MTRTSQRAALAGVAAALLLAAPAAADPAPVPPSEPTNVLTCGATGPTVDVASAVPATLASCTIDAPTAGELVVLGSAGVAFVDAAVEIAAYPSASGAAIPGAQRWVDTGDDAGEGIAQRAASVLGARRVGPGQVVVALSAYRSQLPGTARLESPRVVGLFVPDAAGIALCAGAAGNATGLATTLTTLASCTVAVGGPAHALVLGAAGGAFAGDRYDARASLVVDGAETISSERSWTSYGNGGDGSDVAVGTGVVTAVGAGTHTFALAYQRTTGPAETSVLSPLVVALVVPDEGTALRTCGAGFASSSTFTGAIRFGTVCSLTASGPGTLVTGGGSALRPAAASAVGLAASLLPTADAQVLDTVTRTLRLPAGTSSAVAVPYQDAALRAIAGAGTAGTGINGDNAFGSVLAGPLSTYALFVPDPDLTAPGTAVTGGPPSLGRSRAAAFSLSSPDADVAGYRCSLDGAVFAPCTSPLELADVPDGAHDLRVSAVDRTGHVDPSPATWTWAVDGSAPTIEISSPADGARVALESTLVAAFACADANEHTCVGDVDAGALLDTATLGPHAFTVRAADGLGNARATTHVYTVVPRPLTITAADATSAWGARLPTIGSSIDGLVSPDTPASLGAIRCGPVAAGARPAPGRYATRCAGAASPRYAIAYRDGTLTVRPPARAGAPRLGVRRPTPVAAGARRLTLTCALDRPGLTRCAAVLVARVGGRATTLARAVATAPAALRPGALRLTLPVDARLRRLARRPGGLSITVRLSATQIGYARPLVRDVRLRLVPGSRRGGT